MKKLLVLFAVVIVFSAKLSAQIGGNNTTTVCAGGFTVDSGFAPPPVDTTQLPFAKGGIRSYQLGENKYTHALTYYNGSSWINIAAAGSPSSLAIGTPITGGTIDGVLYQNGSNNLTQSSDFLFNPISHALTINAISVGSGTGGAFNVTGGGVTTSDGVNWMFGTSTGSQIGTSTSQKIAFYGSTPIIQPNSGSLLVAMQNLGLVGASVTNPSGTVTSITAGTGLSGGTITTSGTIGVANPVYTKTVTLTSSQILNLSTVPDTLIPAPGSGYTLVILAVIMDYSYGGTAYAGGPYEFFIGSAAQTVTISNFVTFTSSFIARPNLNYSGCPTPSINGGLTTLDNAPYILSACGAITTGNGTLKVIIQYIISQD